MNSVSIPSRPVSRARCARSETMVSTVAIRAEGYGRRGGRRAVPPGRPAGRCGWSADGGGGGGAGGGGGGGAGRRGGGVRGLERRLVRPVAALGVEVARGVLGVALALARDPDAKDDVQHPHGDAGGDDRDAAPGPAQAAPGRDGRDQAARNDRHRKPDADEAHHTASGAAVSTSGEKRSTSSAGVAGSPGSARPTVK